MTQTLMLIAWHVLINGILQINGFLFLWIILKKWLKKLSIHLKYVTILRNFNFYGTMGKTFLTMNGPIHLDLYFLGNKCNLELYKRTFWDGSKDFLKICFSWKTIILSLEILEFSYAWRQISSNSFNCNFLNELALSKLKSNIFITQYDLCSNSTCMWQAWPKTSL